MFNIRQKQKGFILLETFMVIIFSLIVAAVAAASVISYKKAADLKNQISDAKELLQNISSVTKTSTTWLQPNKTDLNVFNTLGSMQALPYSLQTQYVAGKTNYISRLGGIMNIAVSSVSPPGNTQLNLKFTGISSSNCDELADSLLLPGIVSLSINGVNQPLGPTGNPSSRDPASATYATACAADNKTLLFTYQKQSMIINSGISDVDFSDPSWVVGSGGKKVAGVGITQTGTAGVIVKGPGTSFDRGLYEARIYANNLKASVNVEIAYVPTQPVGASSVTIFKTTDQNNPQGSLEGTTQYIQGLGFNPSPSATAQSPQTFVADFDLPEDAKTVTMTVTSNDTKTITITKLTIYPVNPN